MVESHSNVEYNYYDDNCSVTESVCFVWIPEQLVSDNRPQFTANTFSDFMKANGMKHIPTVPYHPASNGEADSFVQIFKHSESWEK